MSLTRKVSAGLAQVNFLQYIGEAGHIFYDNDNGELRFSDGQTPGGLPIVVAVSNANIGNLVITNTNISTFNANQDISMSTNGSGNVNIYGSFKVYTDGPGSNVSFAAAATGLLTINAPTLLLGQTGLLINGSSAATTSVPQVNGTTFRSVGNDGVVNSVAVDAYGTGAFPAFVHRTGRGTGASPTATQAGDTIGRWGAVGWGTTNFVIDQISGRAASDIRFVATENFSDSAGGTEIQFYTSPNGGTVRTLSAIIAANGFVTGNVTASNLTTANITVGNFTQTGNSTILGTRTILGNSIYNGYTTFNGQVTHNGNLILNGPTTHTGDTFFDGNLTVSQGLTIDGDATYQGNLTVDGTLFVNGSAVITNQVVITGTGNISFNDGTVQTTAAIQQINNSGHVTGALGFIGNIRTLTLTTDATSSNTPGTLVSRDASGNIGINILTAQSITATAINGNNSIAGSMIVYGNLQVLGTTTTVNSSSLVLPSKTVIVSNNATTGSQADGSGLQVGNATVFATFLYDNSLYAPAWRSNIDIVPAVTNLGNIGTSQRSWNQLYAQNGYITDSLYIGVIPPVDQQTVLQVTANVAGFSQIFNQNISTDTQASTDYIAANDLGSDDTTNYLDLGINSSQYANVAYGVTQANDGYLYINGGNIAIGTQSLGSDVIFFTDNTTAASEAGRIHLKRWILGGLDDGYSKLQVTGNVNVSGNIMANTVSSWNITNLVNSTTQANIGMLGYVNNSTTTANIGMRGYVDNSTTTANVGMKGYVDFANTIQSAQIGAANLAITSANVGMKGYVDAVTTAWTANAYQQQALIGNLQVSSYSNVNLAAYLSGNITTGNITNNGNIQSVGGNIGYITIYQNQIYSQLTTTDIAIGQTTATANIVLNRNVNAVKNVNVTGNVTATNFYGNAAAATLNNVGLWTPTLTFTTQGTQTYTLQVGNYVKTGRMVYATFAITISSLGGGSGNFSLTMTGLPTPMTTTGAAGDLVITTQTIAAANPGMIFMAGEVASAANSVAVFGTLVQAGGGGSTTYRQVTATDLGGTASITGKIQYISAT